MLKTCPHCQTPIEPEEICCDGRELELARKALRMGLEIWDEYLSQIAHCVSQDYGRLNEFPIRCRALGIELEESGPKSR